MMFALLLQFLPFRKSDPGPDSGHFPPPPTTVHAFVLIAGKVQHFLLLTSNCAYTLDYQSLSPVSFCIIKMSLGGARTREIDLSTY